MAEQAAVNDWHTSAFSLQPKHLNSFFAAEAVGG